MIAKEISKFIWNGGLDPLTADPTHLRRRRTISTTWVLLLPVAIVLMLTSTYIANSPDENLEISAVVIVALAGLYFQASRGWERFAAYSLVGILWLAPTSVMYREGISSGNWTWLLSAVLMAQLVVNRTMATVYTLLTMSTLILFAILTNNGYLPRGLIVDNHGLSVGVVGSLGIIIMGVLGYTFRTHQIATEKKLNSNLLRLEQEIESRRNAEQAALAAQKAKARFLATVSHELRTPLNGVIGAGQLLEKVDLYKKERELIDTINNSGEMLLDLINNVLDLSRLEAGRLELEQEELHVETLINSTLTPFNFVHKMDKLEICYHISDSVPKYLVSDATRIQQIIFNMTNYAMNFTEEGKIEVLVSFYNGELLIDMVVTGIGIEVEASNRLIEALKQSENTTKSPSSGSALGLSIVVQLVQLFEGDISVQLQAGSGATFRVALPVAPVESSDSSRSQDSENIEALEPSLTVLVTDDNAINRKVASKMLEQLGCEVVEAVDGKEAITAIKANKIDVILMDVNMPVMDGITATSRIREMSLPLCRTPIVGLTADAMPSSNSELLAAGMDDSLSKPVKLQALRKALIHASLLQ